MATSDDGGPAFPGECGNDPSDLRRGMSLRDYFAGQAMAAMISCYRTTMRGIEDAQSDLDADRTMFDRDMAVDQNSKTGDCDGCVEIAWDAYRFADAMLAARVNELERPPYIHQSLSYYPRITDTAVVDGGKGLNL